MSSCLIKHVFYMMLFFLKSDPWPHNSIQKHLFLISRLPLYSSIKFVFGSNLQGCLFHYRQSLYRKWQQLGLSCVKVKEVVSWVKQLMASPLLPTNKIHSVFFEFSSPVLGIKVLDSMATLFSFIEKEWIQPVDPKMLSVQGKFRMTNSEVEGFHSSFGKPNGRKRPNFWFFFKLKSVGKVYQLEANQLREGILTRKKERKKELNISETHQKYYDLNTNNKKEQSIRFGSGSVHLKESFLKALCGNNFMFFSSLKLLDVSRVRSLPSAYSDLVGRR